MKLKLHTTFFVIEIDEVKGHMTCDPISLLDRVEEMKCSLLVTNSKTK